MRSSQRSVAALSIPTQLQPLLARLVLSLLALGIAVSLTASAASASSSCPNEGFRTGPGANLPDCRAYEMVSPPDKNGGEVDGGPVLEGTPPAPEQASANGEALTYGSQTTFTEANPQSSPLTSQYLSRRGPNGWSTQAITPPQDLPGRVFDDGPGAVEFSPFQGFTEDLAHGFLLANDPAPVPGAPAGYFNPYVRDNLDGSYRLLSAVTPPVAAPGLTNSNEGLKVEFAGMSADASHVVFSANDKLTPEALPGKRSLYESNDGQLELVSVLPNGEAPEGAVFGRVEFDQGETNEGYDHVLSADGSRAFWTAYTPGLSNQEGQKQIYMHELTAGGARTVLVSASQKTNGAGPGGTDPNGPLPAVYRTASADGGKAFFSSCEQLTNDSTAGPAEGEDPASVYESCRGAQIAYGEGRNEDLYSYDTSTGKLADLSVDPTPGQNASIVSVLGAGADGSYVYFVAHGALVAGAPSGPTVFNIYVSHDGALSLVATLNLGDYKSERFRTVLFGSSSLLEANTVRVSPNGRYLAFESTEPLTGYDTTPPSAGACTAVTSFWAGTVQENTTDRCIEVYEYDAVAGRLACASCNPRGLPPTGDSVVPMPRHLVVDNAGWQTSNEQQRYLLDDGRLFFDSGDSLLPQASNGGVLNVYEYEPGGTGTCQRASCLALISSGTSNENSLFTDASANGDDVFFITRQQLVSQDGDESLDEYDARVGGGFSSLTPPACGGEACRPPVSSAPSIYGAPPSATFAGAGNPAIPVAKPKAATKKKKAKPKRKAKKPKRKQSKKAKKSKQARRSRARTSTQGSHR